VCKTVYVTSPTRQVLKIKNGEAAPNKGKKLIIVKRTLVRKTQINKILWVKSL